MVVYQFQLSVSADAHAVVAGLFLADSGKYLYPPSSRKTARITEVLDNVLDVACEGKCIFLVRSRFPHLLEYSYHWFHVLLSILPSPTHLLLSTT